ncbi:hypothetical protein ROZALSC1DRAFT_22249, partial [Rozella allomycis CSF55]
MVSICISLFLLSHASGFFWSFNTTSNSCSFLTDNVGLDLETFYLVEKRMPTTRFNVLAFNLSNYYVHFRGSNLYPRTTYILKQENSDIELGQCTTLPLASLASSYRIAIIGVKI